MLTDFRLGLWLLGAVRDMVPIGAVEGSQGFLWPYGDFNHNKMSDILDKSLLVRDSSRGPWSIGHWATMASWFIFLHCTWEDE